MRTFAALLLAILAIAPVTAAEYKADQQVFRFNYGYGSAEDIPGTTGVTQGGTKCHPTEIPFGPEETERDSLGVSYAYFLADDVSLVGNIAFPVGDPGAGNLSGSVGLDYYFGHWVVPAALGYRGDLDSAVLNLGVGYDYPFKDGVVLRLSVGPQYLFNHELTENWSWVSQAGVGWVW